MRILEDTEYQVRSRNDSDDSANLDVNNEEYVVLPDSFFEVGYLTMVLDFTFTILKMEDYVYVILSYLVTKTITD